MNLGLNLGLKFSAGSADLCCEQYLGWIMAGGHRRPTLDGFYGRAAD
jgi:hypothetical protein